MVASESFLTRLAERLNGGGWWGRQPAAELVGKLGSAALTNKDILPRLAERLDDENGWVREAAAEAVGVWGVRWRPSPSSHAWLSGCMT